MKTKDGYIQGYNAQAAVDGCAQIIVAHGLIQTTSDHGQVVPLVDGIESNLGRKPAQASADNGYLSETNLEALSARGVDGYIATGRAKHPTADNGKVGGPLTQAMRKKIADGGFDDTLPAAQADCRSGVRTDQTSPRLPPVPVARRRKRARRMGDDLPRPQPHQARKHRLSGLSFGNLPVPKPIWTGS